MNFKECGIKYSPKCMNPLMTMMILNPYHHPFSGVKSEVQVVCVLEFMW